MAKIEYEKSIFINCPFDREYAALLQAILFCVTYLGFVPKLASERQDSGESRLEKIVELIQASKFSIHDLSRCKSDAPNELSRMNMPFELGIDYGCRRYYRGRSNKRILVLEEQPYRYQAALSDFAGCDIKHHDGDFAEAIRQVRNWMRSETEIDSDGAARIIGAYYDFQEWYYEKQLAAGFSEEDIQDYPTTELLAAMRQWFALGKPIT